LALHPGKERLVLAREERDRLANGLLILLLGDQAFADPAASAQMIPEADLVRQQAAGPDLEVLRDEVEQCLPVAGADIRPEPFLLPFRLREPLQLSVAPVLAVGHKA